MSNKTVYIFGDGKAEGNATMKPLLGGKGGNLAEMNLIGIPVPAGFTLTTEVCTLYNKNGHDAAIKLIKPEVEAAVAHTEKIMNAKFGTMHDDFPLLLSVRSGARASMPGMMNTVLNLGMNDHAVEVVAERSKNPRFAWDSYRRFIQMYAGVVLGLEIKKDEVDPFEVRIEKMKKEKGYVYDTEFTAKDLKKMVKYFKEIIHDHTGLDFPDDPWDQLWGAISAVFDSWNTPRAKYYRKMNRIPDDWGTAVNVQAMVYGNMGITSATGVAFTRDAATGENRFNGEYLINAQGEDVVSGVRTPQEISLEGSKRWAALQEIDEADRAANYPSLEETMPEIYKNLDAIQNKLEKHYKNMQDIEFTIQDGKLWLLQTRDGKRTGSAMVKMAMDMFDEGLIDERTSILRLDATKLDELLHPVFHLDELENATVLTKGLPASPGAATGRVVFHPDDAIDLAKKGRRVILVRQETSPEDLAGMDAAKGILTARGGMTSHAAVVARGMGKCCISGAGQVQINYKKREFSVNGTIVNEGDHISLNGSTGEVFIGEIPTIDPELSGDFARIMQMADKHSQMKVRTNADTPHDAAIARKFGAQGIGLCRTEHMFFKDERIHVMREMILAPTEMGRRKALNKLLPMQRSDFEGIFEAMQGLGVTIRLLDPPLHEFVPKSPASIRHLAKNLGITTQEIKSRIAELEEFNPMLGHRGCRLGNTYPEITEMQTRAIIEAAINLKQKDIKACPEIMIPLVGTLEEYKQQAALIKHTANKVFEERGEKIKYEIGTMIEIPRATLIADKIANEAEFFSFGTNDLTQMVYGYSRDDAVKFMPVYYEKGILKHDPFEVIDEEGVGELMELGTTRGRSVKPNLKVGICGEHGGEPSAVEFCNTLGFNYVSCSPFRVPIARLAAAQAVIRQK